MRWGVIAVGSVLALVATAVLLEISSRVNRCPAFSICSQNIAGVALGVVILIFGLILIVLGVVLSARPSRRDERVEVPTGRLGFPRFRPMVWVRCTECGKPVDWPAQSCPRCGRLLEGSYRSAGRRR